MKKLDSIKSLLGFGYYGGVSHYKRLLRAGVRIFEWQGHEDLRALEEKHNCKLESQWPGLTLHTKAVMFDGEVSLIGSHNMNVRSEKYNTELTAMIIDPELTGQLEDIFREDLGLQGPNTIVCSGQILLMPDKVREVEIKKVKKFLKKNWLKIQFLKHFHVYM